MLSAGRFARWFLVDRFKRAPGRQIKFEKQRERKRKVFDFYLSSCYIIATNQRECILTSVESAIFARSLARATKTQQVVAATTAVEPNSQPVAAAAAAGGR